MKGYLNEGNKVENALKTPKSAAIESRIVTKMFMAFRK